MEYIQTLSEILKSEILKNYQNIKQFSDASGIPYMTISSVLKRGVENSVFGTVLRICNALNISIDGLLRDRALNSIKEKLQKLGDAYTHEALRTDLIETKVIFSYYDDSLIDELTEDYRDMLLERHQD